MSLKVYISKSKAGSLIELEKVKQELSAFDVEITEFEGGTYNTTKLDEADYVVVIPPNAFLEVGKGQAEEIERALFKDKKILIIVDELTNGKSLIVELLEEDLNYLKHNWQTEWLSIEFPDEVDDATFADFFRLKPYDFTNDKKFIETVKLLSKDSPAESSIKEPKKKIKPMLAILG